MVGVKKIHHPLQHSSVSASVLSSSSSFAYRGGGRGKHSSRFSGGGHYSAVSVSQLWVIRLTVAVAGGFFLFAVFILALTLPRSSSSYLYSPFSFGNYYYNYEDEEDISSLSSGHWQDVLRQLQRRNQKRLMAAAASTTTTSGGGGTAHNKNNKQHQHQPAPHRLALILPYVGEGPEQVPTFLNLFCQGARAAADVADFLIVHNGVLSLDDLEFPACQKNVALINLQSTQAMAERLLRVLHVRRKQNLKRNNGEQGEQEHDEKEQDEDWRIPKDRLLGLLTAHLRVYPYTLVEYKPAYGYIFQDFLEGYTHWGYTDMDMMYGDLGRHIEASEWTDYDIVTFGFGDQQRLYVKGQFTMHKNTDAVRTLWEDCRYLSHLDERWYNLIKSSSNQEGGSSSSTSFQLESAEGCYSAALLQNTDISIKYAVKAWTDVSTSDATYAQGLYLFPNPQHVHKHVLVKAATTVPSLSLSGEQPQPRVVDLAPDWFQTDAVYKDTTKPLQVPLGAMEPLTLPIDSHHDKNNNNCMYWVQRQYQQHLCLTESVSASETVYWVQGRLYKQAFTTVELPSTVGMATTGPFFHFQEWKRRFRSNQLAVLEEEDAQYYHSHHHHSHHSHTYQPSTPPIAIKVLLPEGGVVVAPRSSGTSTTGTTSSQRIIGAATTHSWGSGPPPSPLGIPLFDWKACRHHQHHHHPNKKDDHNEHKNHRNHHEEEDRSQLPSRLYCLSGMTYDKLHQQQEEEDHHHDRPRRRMPLFRMDCLYALTWRNQDEVQLLSTAPAWRNDGGNKNNKNNHHHKSLFTRHAASQDSSSPPISSESSVTLVQTVQIPLDSTRESVALVLATLEENLERWNGQPCVVLLYVSPQVVHGTLHRIRKFVSNLDETILDTSLIAMIVPHRKGRSSPSNQDNNGSREKKEDHEYEDAYERIISEKALQNMAVDVVPTRWYVCGLNDGYVTLSPDTAELARRKAVAHQNLYGNVFWIPTFANRHNRKNHNEFDDDDNDNDDNMWSLSNWIHPRRQPLLFRGTTVSPLCSKDNEGRTSTGESHERDDAKSHDFLARANRLWLEQTGELIHPSQRQSSSLSASSSSSSTKNETESNGLDDDDGRIRFLAERLQGIEYALVSGLLEQGGGGGSDLDDKKKNAFQHYPYAPPVLLIDNLLKPNSTTGSTASSNISGSKDNGKHHFNHLHYPLQYPHHNHNDRQHYQKTHVLAREVEEFGGGGHGGCFPLLRLTQMIVWGYAFNVLEGAFGIAGALEENRDSEEYEEQQSNDDDDDEEDATVDDPTVTAHRLWRRRSLRKRLCSASCVYLDQTEAGRELRNQILEHEVLRSVLARTLWTEATATATTTTKTAHSAHLQESSHQAKGITSRHRL